MFEKYIEKEKNNIIDTVTQVCKFNSVSKKDDTVTGEFLYMHEKNYNYIKKDSF